METKTIDKLFLELSQVTKAMTERELSLEQEKAELEDQLDLCRDEFTQIISCPDVTSEIVELAKRGSNRITQHVPVITQRDKAEVKVSQLQLEKAELEGKLREVESLPK